MSGWEQSSTKRNLLCAVRVPGGVNCKGNVYWPRSTQSARFCMPLTRNRYPDAIYGDFISWIYQTALSVPETAMPTAFPPYMPDPCPLAIAARQMRSKQLGQPCICGKSLASQDRPVPVLSFFRAVICPFCFPPIRNISGIAGSECL